MTVQKYIRENVNLLGDRTYIAPNIPEKKLNAAISIFAENVNPDYVIALHDSSIFSTGKEGCLFLGDSVYLKAAFEKPLKIEFVNIDSIRYETYEKEASFGKSKTVKQVFVYFKNGEELELSPYLLNVNYEAFTKVIQGILNEAEAGAEFENSSQVTPLAQLSEEVKVNYIKVVCNFSYSDDQIIDPYEYAEIISLIARIELDSVKRIEIRSYMSDINNVEENSEILERLKINTSETSFEVLGKSLIKDILYIFKQRHSIQEWSQNDFINYLVSANNIQKDEIELIIQAIQNDEDILKQRKNDSEIAKSIKDIAAKAGAIGVPMAAIYFSGSVVGFSAAGITSGLAAMGLGGILGLSGMVTGIGTIILLGVGTYHGLKKITGIGDLQNNKQREFMLQAIIRNTQKSLNYLIEDMNEISNQLMNEIKKGNENSQKIQKLSELLNTLSQGAQFSVQKQNHSQIEQLITKLPLKLDMIRLLQLTQKATQEKIQDFIISCYELSIMSKNNEGTEEVWSLRENLPLSDLEQLYECFEQINYNKLAQATLATAVGSTKGFVKNIFGEKNE